MDAFYIAECETCGWTSPHAVHSWLAEDVAKVHHVVSGHEHYGILAMRGGADVDYRPFDAA